MKRKGAAGLAGEFVLTQGGGVTLSREAVEKLLGSASGDAALLYIYILSRGGHLDADEAAGAIHRSALQVENATGVLTRLGLVSPVGTPEPPQKLRPAEERPQYTSEDIKHFTTQDGKFPILVSHVQQSLGTTLSSEGVRTLLGIYDHLRLPPEVILTLVNWCIARSRERYGEGRTPSMRYIEREAYIWEREGILSLEAADDYMRRQAALSLGEREMAAALGLSGRRLSETEKKYIDSWLGMGFRADAAEAAYDRTVVKTGKLTWRYMDSIMRSWHSKGIRTARDIEERDAPPEASRPGKRHQSSDASPGAGRSRLTARELDGLDAALKLMEGDDNES